MNKVGEPSKSYSTQFLDESEQDDTVIVFVIGGISFSEIKYSLSTI